MLFRSDDLGEALGCGANVIALRRLQAGTFTQAQCVTIERLRELKEAGGLASIDALLCPADTAVKGLPAVVLPQQTANFLKLGQAVMVRHLPLSGLVRLYEEEEFIGIGTILDDGRVAPKRLFAT